MNRKDYRKLMEQKKRNKTYAKMTILGALGLGVALSNNTTANAESREWKANETTTIKSGDTEYKIIWGDTLSLISRDSGITMDTLATLNNILNQDLIFEGNIIVFGDGATATVKDANGNVIAETPLTTEDKAGITEAQNNATNSVNSSNANGSSSTKNNGTATNTNNSKNNNSVINTNNGKDNGSTNSNGNGGNTTKPVNPIKPVDPTKPTDPVKPVEPVNPVDPTDPVSEKMLATRTYFDVDTEEYFGTDTLEVTLKDGKAVVKADTIPKGFKLADGETGVREVSKAQSTASFKVVKIEDITPPVVQEFTITINHVTQEDGKILSSETKTAKEGTTVNAQSLNFEDRGYVLVSEETQSIIANSNQTITFIYKKVNDEKPYEPQHTSETVTVNVDINGSPLSSTEGFDYVSESTDSGVTTTAENGDTHTIYTKTIVWKLKETTPDLPHPSSYGGKYTTDAELIVGESGGTLYSGVGNTGATFPTLMDASLFALDTLAEMGTGGNYWTWQVKFLDGTVWYTTSIFPK